LPHILIVDDERAILALLSRAFSRAGFDVTLANSAFDAMEFCNSKAFDAVLSDVDMPRMNGHELVRWIGDKHPRVRCALMSAFHIECEECPYVGRCHVLRKPFIPNDAIALIRQMLTVPN